MNFPKIRVTVPEGRRVLSTVEIDGRQWPVTRFAFDTGDIAAADGGLVKVRMEFYADLLVVGEVPLAVTDVEKVAAQ